MTARYSPSHRGRMKAFFHEVLDTLRTFGKECTTIPSLALLGYATLVVTHHIFLDDRTIEQWMGAVIPYASDRLIRKDVLDVVLQGLTPALLILLVHRHNPMDYGLRWPPRRYVYLTLAVFAAQLFGIAVAAQIPSLRAYYPAFHPARAGGALFWKFQVLAFCSMIAWEYFNRGYLLFSLKPRFGLAAVVIQTVPFVVLHLGKPPVELYWSIIVGLALGLLAYVSGSIWPAVVLHAVGALMLDVTIVYIMP